MMCRARTAPELLSFPTRRSSDLVITGLNSGLSFIESKVGVTAQLVGKPEQADLTPARLDAHTTYPQAPPGVKSVHYVGTAEALERLKEVYAQRGQKLELGNDPEH